MPTMAEVRQKYPQYQDMSDQQLADALYKKFYSDMPRAEFNQKLGIAPVQQQPQSIGDQLSAGFTAGVNAIPIAGPSILSGLEQLKGMVQGRPAEDVHATDAAQVEQNPVASTVGQVAGTVVPFAVGGAIPGVARVLGMAGGLGSRVGFGLASGGLIGAADTGVRGGNVNDMLASGGIGVGIGATLPIAGKVIGGVLNKALGKSVPKEARLIGRALKDDNIPASEINQRLTDLGPGSMVMDLGPNLRQQAGGLASVPGAAQKTVRSAIEGRATLTGSRVADDVAKTLGTGPELSALREQVVAAQQVAATPLYNAVRDVPVQMLQGNYAFVFGTPLGKRALQVGRQMAANDGYKGTDTVGIVDYAKRALDDIASSAARKGDRNLARQASQLARVLTTETDKAVPQYRAAREAFAGPAQVLDAMDAGEAVFTKEMTPRQLQQSLTTMTASERDAFIQAARSAVESNMGNAVNDALALRNMFKKSFNEEKLRIILGNDVADDLLKRINREAAFGKTANVVGGNSETAARQAAQGEVAPELGRTWRPDGVVSLLLTAFDKARSGLAGKLQPKINANMAGVLTAPQLDARAVQQLARAARPDAQGWIAPAAGGLLTGPNKPLEITIHGGR